jgi:Omp85 superfamily domain
MIQDAGMQTNNNDSGDTAGASRLMRQALMVLALLLVLAPARAEDQPAEPGKTETSKADKSVHSFLIDRRKEQFATSFAYAVFPLPYSLPGIGKGLSVVGGAMNIAHTYTDVYGIVYSGDVQGAAVGMGDFHIVPRTLILDIGAGAVNKASLQSFRERGMGGDRNNYLLMDVDSAQYYGSRLTATFLDRRFEVYGAWYGGASKLRGIRDPDGNTIVQASDSSRQASHTTILGTRIDLTDDYSDPRRGVRLTVSRSASPPANSGPDFAVMDYNLTAYVPMASRNTWVFNVLRSDAVVYSKGETDPAKVQSQMGINCSNPSLTPQQQQYCIDAVNLTIANNTYGTATSLGGFDRLRSYSQGRFRGAHTQFYGSEFRWNLTDTAKPFDLFIMKDVRTSLQLAAFYEMGSTADLSEDVGKVWRKSYGVGVRMITASGVVFRADVADGFDGVATAIFIGYPWEI